MKISVIIPCFNEINTIEIVIENILKKKENYNLQLIVVDDYSTDGTREKLKSISYKLNKLILNKKNYGKGFSVNEGIKICDGDIILIQDADLEYSADDYPKLLNPIINGKADVVYGSRFIGSEEKRVLFFWHFVANKILTLLSNISTNLNLTDMETGYKVFKKELIKDIILEEKKFGFEPEITAKLAKKKPKFYEVGISYFGRTYEEGKKIGWKDAFSAIRCIIKYNFFKT